MATVDAYICNFIILYDFTISLKYTYGICVLR